ncbi:MAG: TraR/DksA family transcriptional regulator [Desulfuromonadales bacterium]|nr:TraR/DksA family transcriptional regulator [Desulfuromonadales bacterium]NIR33506.1 TraR/DksA family transcriptional regulator [Desulfuromonadales bacterium]NIS43537.1 TraR/DksA family transcriptional regulator [Desulfuromonadales bacterium]
MENTIREKLRKRLLISREDLLAEVREQVSEAAELRDEGSADVADAGLTDDLREKLHLMSERQRERIFSIDAALEKLDAGTYGLCAECEEPIDVHRLEAWPEARLCVACKQEQEQREKARRGPGQGTL